MAARRSCARACDRGPGPLCPISAHDEVSADLLRLREESALEECEVQEVEHAALETSDHRPPERHLARRLGRDHRLLEKAGLEAVPDKTLGTGASFDAGR